MRTLPLFLLMVGLVGACGDDSGNSDSNDSADNTNDNNDDDNADSDITVDDTSDGTPDAAIDAPPDSPAVTCTLPAAAALTQQAGATTDVALGMGDPAPIEAVQYGAVANADAAPDAVLIQLYAGYGVFADAPIAPGTYQLTGAESAFDTCGACVLILTDLDMDGNAVAQYMPTAGTLTVTSVNGNFTGTLTNGSFRHVDIEPAPSFATTDNASGCTSTAATYAFDAPITIDMAKVKVTVAKSKPAAPVRK